MIEIVLVPVRGGGAGDRRREALSFGDPQDLVGRS